VTQPRELRTFLDSLVSLWLDAMPPVSPLAIATVTSGTWLPLPPRWLFFLASKLPMISAGFTFWVCFRFVLLEFVFPLDLVESACLLRLPLRMFGTWNCPFLTVSLIHVTLLFTVVLTCTCCGFGNTALTEPGIVILADEVRWDDVGRMGTLWFLLVNPILGRIIFPLGLSRLLLLQMFVRTVLMAPAAWFVSAFPLKSLLRGDLTGPCVSASRSPSRTTSNLRVLHTKVPILRPENEHTWNRRKLYNIYTYTSISE